MIPPKHAFKLSYTQLPYKWNNTTPTTRNALAGGNNAIKGKTISHGLITPISYTTNHSNWR